MKAISIKQMLAYVIRNIGHNNIDGHYFPSLIEWIAEGVELLETTYVLSLTSKILPVCDHVAHLPCGYAATAAIEYQGRRLLKGADITDITRRTSIYHSTQNLRSDADGNTWLATQFIKQNQISKSIAPLYEKLPVLPKEYYFIEANAIKTSFAHGEITLHYYQIPTDEEGYPLVPDIPAYKEAIYWYVLTKLIGAGYKHKVFDFNMVEEQWNGHRNIALDHAKSWTTEDAAKAIGLQTRLIFPMSAYTDFFVNYEQIQQIYRV
jgi:hypothetical protein